jgi:formylglycine-generating enzyme required for sulfatase activity
VEATLGAPKVGHRFPSGATDVSEVWIELVVGDPAAPLYVSGALDAAHYLDPDARVWRRTLVDARGLPVDLHELHRVDRAVASRSVPPGGADAVRWTVPLPPDLAGPVPVRARLRLRRANQRWNDWLFNFDGRTVPVTDVLEARVEVDPTGPPGLDPGPGGASGGAPSGLPNNSGTPDGETADLPRPPPPAPPGMVAIAAGPARIGLDDGEPDEGPAFTVDLPAFAIDRAPVTHGQLKAHLAARGAAGPALRLPWADPLSWAGTTAPAVADDAPAVLLTREEAAAVCAARGARLPTEFEWERAARGAAGHRWPWGDAADPPPCPAVDGRDLPPAVGLCPERASPDGVLDLVGGVVEWTSSPYAAYPRAHLHPNANEWVITFDPGAAAVRGSPARALGPATTAAARTGQNPYQRGRVGFRCAVSLEAR